MIGYLIATAAVFLICFYAYRSRPDKYADLMGVSVMMVMALAVSNLVHTMYGFPEAMLAFPVIDLMLVAMIFRAWMKNREAWKVVVVSAIVVQLMLHLVSIFMWKTGALTMHGLYVYVVALNGLFVVQLLTLGFVGASHGLDNLRRWLSHRRGLFPIPNAR
jgi:hypothetical protein